MNWTRIDWNNYETLPEVNQMVVVYVRNKENPKVENYCIDALHF